MGANQSKPDITPPSFPEPYDAQPRKQQQLSEKPTPPSIMPASDSEAPRPRTYPNGDAYPEDDEKNVFVVFRRAMDEQMSSLMQGIFGLPSAVKRLDRWNGDKSNGAEVEQRGDRGEGDGRMHSENEDFIDRLWEKHLAQIEEHRWETVRHMENVRQAPSQKFTLPKQQLELGEKKVGDSEEGWEKMQRDEEQDQAWLDSRLALEKQYAGDCKSQIMEHMARFGPPVAALHPRYQNDYFREPLSPQHWIISDAVVPRWALGLIAPDFTTTLRTPAEMMWPSAHYLLFSRYSPLILENYKPTARDDGHWRRAFEDLLSTSSVEDPRGDVGAPSNETYRQYIQRLGSRNLLGLPTNSDQSSPSPDEPTTELELYEHAFDEHFNTTSNATVAETGPVEKPSASSAKRSSLSDTAKHATDKPNVLSIMTTTHSVTLPDGTTTTKKVLKRRFADGREETTETVDTSPTHIGATAVPQPARPQIQDQEFHRDEQSKKSGTWFWSK